jgi:2-polyprenyl-3-methyl-5-hydroxy-6-metoxy-1,4-benzoquinol methylase
MSASNTDVEWERWGRADPYFGVITHERFRLSNLNDEARREFFVSGQVHVDYVLAMCRTYIDPGLAPRRVLDFGCGVGRVIIPWAGQAEEVVGLDVSPSMLDEAHRNCMRMGVNNVALHLSTDDLSTWSSGFDLVHTCIVLQHIEQKRGRRLFTQLLQAIKPGGIGALHVTYAKAWLADTFGRDPNAEAEPVVARDVPGTKGLLARLGSLTRPVGPPPPEPQGDPGMQMHSYDLNALLFILQNSGVRRLHVEFTDHGGELGVFVFFQRPTS